MDYTAYISKAWLINVGQMICSLMRASTKPKVSARVPDVPVKIHYQNSTERSAWRLEIPSGRQNKLYVYTEPQILEELIN